MPEHAEPVNAREARERIRELQAAIQSIESQLANPKWTKKGSTRPLSGAQYKAARARSLRALQSRLDELRYLKGWLREYMDRLIAGGLDLDRTDCDALLAASYRAFMAARAGLSEGAELPAEVVATFDLVRDYLTGVGPRGGDA